MMEQLTAQIELLIDKSERTRHESKREVIREQIKHLTRQAAAEFGRGRHWRLSATPFTLPELAGLSCEVQVSRSVFDHPDYYRDSRGRPRAIAVHLYDWPEVGPDVEGVCEHLGLRYEAPADCPSWWYPGWTQLVIYTARAGERKRKSRRSPIQPKLPFPEEWQWVI